MSGRSLSVDDRRIDRGGWLRIDIADLRTKRQLSAWVTTGVTFARSLPPKPARGAVARVSSRRD